MTTGLRARPEVPADVRAAIDAAIEKLVAVQPDRSTAPSAWRFSGRWFSAHPVRGRTRPGG